MSKRKQTVAEVRQEVLELIRTDGLRAAAEGAIAVCRDPTAPAPARATAAGLIFRAAAFGGFGKNDDDGREKEPHEMTGAELSRAADRARQELARQGGEDPDDGGEADESELDDSVFD
jgi:hypothetical protein